MSSGLGGGKCKSGSLLGDKIHYHWRRRDIKKDSDKNRAERVRME